MIETIACTSISTAVEAAMQLPYRIVWVGNNEPHRNRPIRVSTRDITEAVWEQFFGQFKQTESILYFQYDATAFGWELNLSPFCKKSPTPEWKPLFPEEFLKFVGVISD